MMVMMIFDEGVSRAVISATSYRPLNWREVRHMTSPSWPVARLMFSIKVNTLGARMNFVLN